MANYPGWVTAYRTKGTCVNKRNDKYYLYRCHSERIPGTKRVKKVYDEYLGRIDPEEGLIPPKDRIKSPVRTFEYGFSALIISVCELVWKGIQRSYKADSEYIKIVAILTYIYGFYDNSLLDSSWLMFLLPERQVPDRVLSAQTFGIGRTVRMIDDKMKNRFGDALPEIKAAFASFHLALIDGKWYCPEPSDYMRRLSSKYKISEWDVELWQKQITA